MSAVLFRAFVRGVNQFSVLDGDCFARVTFITLASPDTFETIGNWSIHESVVEMPLEFTTRAGAFESAVESAVLDSVLAEVATSPLIIGPQNVDVVFLR